MFEIKWLAPSLAMLVGNSSLDDPLESSVAKWEQVVTFYEEHEEALLECGGSLTCALCHVYGHQNAHTCVGCPIAEATGESHCFGTPYRTYNVAVFDYEDPTAAHRAAEEMVVFLKSLR